MPAKKAPAKKAPPKKSAPKAKPAKKAATKPKAVEPKPEPVHEPEFVKKASAADRKAALEAILEKEAIPKPPPAAPPVAEPAPLPPVVREASPADRKAAVEQLVEESGVAGALSKAPWKRGPVAPAPPVAPPQPAPPAPRTAPRAVMTKAPFESTTGKSAPKVVILDSNALMMQFQFHVDIEREVRRILNINFDVVVPGVVVHELERLAKQGQQKEAAEARMALELAKTFRIEPTENDGDTAIFRLAERLNAIVVTNDKRLRAMLRAKAIPNIYMRSRAFLTLEGHIPGM